MMTSHKRHLDETFTKETKKIKLSSEKSENTGYTGVSVPSTSAITLDEIDFPRGGGTVLTPLEVKTFRAEAVEEADQELFASTKQTQVGNKCRKPNIKRKVSEVETEKLCAVRVEHLNYKRLALGMKVFGQVMSIQPLAIVVSLPNQLLAHVPITQITSQLTKRLESTNGTEDGVLENDADDDDESDSSSRVPDLGSLFCVGQYVRAVVVKTHASGAADAAGLGRARSDVVKASRRVELSLIPENVNVGVQKADFRVGYSLSAAVQSVEDHGYILDLGVTGVSGFLPFEKASSERSRLPVGALIDVSVSKMSSNRRICTVTNNSDVLMSSSVFQVSNVSSVLPGLLVQSVITAIARDGLNLQILGFFDATADEFHLSRTHKNLKVGQKVKTRVLYDLPGVSPPRFVVTLADHHIKLQSKTTSEGQPLSATFPVGAILDQVKVRRVETERGLHMDIQPDQEGFVHISQISDEHVATLSAFSGPWKPDTCHKARVIGYHPFDGILQLSLRPSVFEQRFVQAGEVQVGEVLKGFVKQLTDSALFVSISGNVDGVIWPSHYADIPLKHPTRKFKVGTAVKCRVLTVDPERNRIILTAKKTLLYTAHPILTSFSDARVGVLTHAVIFRVTDKYLMVEFFNNVKAIVPAREASETGAKLADIYAPGRVITVRIISIRSEVQQIVASIRQATSLFPSAPTDISGVLKGDIVEGVVIQLHKLNVVLSLKPSNARALISFSGLARHWKTTIPELQTSLGPGASIDSLVVVSRNPEKNFVVVTGNSKNDRLKKAALTMDSITIGQIVYGRVIKYTRYGAHVKLTTRLSGSLHPTDTSDDYETGNPFPGIDSVVKAAVIGIDKSNNHLLLSTRASRLSPNDAEQQVDREINRISDLNVGDTARGFVKSVAEHGLFVTLGKGIDARVQIKELFDEYIKDWKGQFVVNQLIRGRILNIDITSKKIEMTFRSGDPIAPLNSLAFGDLREGQKIVGRVKRIEQYGLFIEIEGSTISGLCHKSQLSDNRDADVIVALRSFREGDRVRAFIVSRDLEKKQLSLSLKPSYFADEKDEQLQNDVPNFAADTKSYGVPYDAGLQEESQDGPSLDEEESCGIGEGYCDIEDDDLMQVGPASPDIINSPKLCACQETSLKVHGFQWFANDADHREEFQIEAIDSSDDEVHIAEKRKRKKHKEIEMDATADIHMRLPDSNADFERMLLGSPDSSYLWIQYMSFHLKLSEIDKARAVGRRAIQAIHFREEQEKLNVWIALLNLENVYGTDTTLEAVFKDAARHNDSKTIHLRLATIFDESGKHEKAEEQYRRTYKKFGRSSKVWTLFCEHYLRRGLAEDARKLLSRSLQSLHKRKHLKTISKFAQLEYKLGDVERGRTIFEGIVDSHRRRWDIWSIYIDMEARKGNLEHLRSLFNHVLTVKMTSHNAKAFFKKWLDLERKLGDEEGAMAVKQKAVEWTQTAAGTV